MNTTLNALRPLLPPLLPSLLPSMIIGALGLIGLPACDADELNHELDELDAAADDELLRSGSCSGGEAISASKWRIRNAVATSSGQLAFRELDFCTDAQCTQPLSGTAIDSGYAFGWAPPANAFDDDNGTMWKTGGAGTAGARWIGLEFSSPETVTGVFLRTDNTVYSADTLYVEYYDDDSASWIAADVLFNLPPGSEQTHHVEHRETFPVSWRIRNATATNGQWAFRELDFCTDPDCSEPLSGTAIDSGYAFGWAPPANAFDNDNGTMWKTGGAGTAGARWIGLELDDITDIYGVFLKTDNPVYAASAVYLEYFDYVDQAWITADYESGLPASSELTRSVEVRDRFPLSWRIRNASTTSSDEWVFREIDFCADADCTTPQVSGTAIDSGDAYGWAPASYAFDDDALTLWKSMGADLVGNVYLGMDYGEVTEVAGLFLKTDNVVYSASSIDVEYYDAVLDAWILAESLTGVPAGAELTYDLEGCE